MTVDVIEHASEIQQSLCTFVQQPDKSIDVGYPNEPRSLIQMSAGVPLLRNLRLISNKNLDAICQRYGYNVILIKRAIMRGVWC